MATLRVIDGTYILDWRDEAGERRRDPLGRVGIFPKRDAEEHYVAHQLLVKMYPGVRALAAAATMMAKRCSGNKAYGWLRRQYTLAILGKKFSPEHRANMSTAMRVRMASPETRAKLSEAGRGRRHSLESRAKMSIAFSGRKRAPATRAKISAAMRGNHYTLGFRHSPETRAKMSAARIGKKFSPEQLVKRYGAKHSPERRANILAGLRAHWAAKQQANALPPFSPLSPT